MWSGKFMSRSWIKGYHVLLTGAKTIKADDKTTKMKQKIFSELKLFNFTAYNKLLIAEEDTVCFQIIEEANMEDNNYGAARLVLTKLSKKIEANTEASKTKLCKNIAKCKVDNVTRNLKK